MGKFNNLWGPTPRHHISFGPKEGHMTILERMHEINKNCTSTLKIEIIHIKCIPTMIGARFILLLLCLIFLRGKNSCAQVIIQN
jgi:hypothetical protein